MTSFYFTEKDVERLEKQAVQIRQDIVSMIHAAKAGHPGGSLSAVEMVTALYFHVMNIDPQNPKWADRDRFILSKGSLISLFSFPSSIFSSIKRQVDRGILNSWHHFAT